MASKYSFKNVRKAVFGAATAAVTFAGSLALAFADFPELASGAAVLGTAATYVVTFLTKNEDTLDAAEDAAGRYGF